MAQATHALHDSAPDGESPRGGGAQRTGSPQGGGDTGDRDRVDGVARLHLVLPARPDLTRIGQVLGSEAAPWLGEPVTRAPGPTREYACDLDLPVGDLGPILFRKSAIVGLGEPRRDGPAWRVAVEWRAATFKPLFPVFAGTLTIREAEIVLDGHYAPPGGRLGVVLDAALLNIAARGTGRWFLHTVVAALGPDAP